MIVKYLTAYEHLESGLWDIHPHKMSLRDKPKVPVGTPSPEALNLIGAKGWALFGIRIKAANVWEYIFQQPAPGKVTENSHE